MSTTLNFTPVGATILYAKTTTTESSAHTKVKNNTHQRNLIQTQIRQTHRRAILTFPAIEIINSEDAIRRRSIGNSITGL